MAVRPLLCPLPLLAAELVKKGMTNASKSPRGVRGFKLNSGTFGTWKVQGKIGGYTRYASYPCLSNTLPHTSFPVHIVFLTARAVC